MCAWSRREFLTSGSVAAALAAAGLACASNEPTAGPGPPRGATPAGGTNAMESGTIKPGSSNDIDHIVIFFQENRSFDHYFGTRRGGRGFGDRDVGQNSEGRSVWYQPYDKSPDGYLLPYRLDTAKTNGACGPDPDHSWIGQHIAFNGGRNDGFAALMGPSAMGYFTREDLPYYYALADNFNHVPPPVPPPGTTDEFISEQPIGLGFRVPTVVVSPWSRGGRVDSGVYDHTSTLMFIEKRFGVEVPNISAWRRKTCRDLTGALNFTKPDTSVPKLPDTAARLAAAKNCATLPAAAPPNPQIVPTTEN